MRIVEIPRYIFFCATAAAIVAAGCSNTSGFGPSAGPGPGGQYPNSGPYEPGTSPIPSSSLVPGAQLEPGAHLSPAAATSAIPLSGAVEVAGATARLAYDGSAADPQKAQRILIVTFAVKNASKAAISVKKLSVTGTGDYRPIAAQLDNAFMPPGAQGTSMPTKTAAAKSTAASSAPQTAAVSVDVPSGKQSNARVIAMTVPDDVAMRKQVAVQFLPAKGKALATATIDVAASDISTTPLDEKAPKGRLSVDSVDVQAVQMTSPGPHYATTFAVTNPGMQPVSITNISIAPPKTTAAKIALPVTLQPRTTTAFITIVLPYAGKSLPTGKYTVKANGAAGSLASGFGTIL